MAAPSKNYQKRLNVRMVRVPSGTIALRERQETNRQWRVENQNPYQIGSIIRVTQALYAAVTG